MDLVQVRKNEIVEFSNKFYRTSWNSRSQAYHTRWDKWERNFRNIYDPTFRAKKESWQATMFDPATLTNVEVISAAITKILLSKKRPIGVEPREMGDELQAELHTDLISYEIDRSDFQTVFYDVLKQALVFGSGFAKFYWEKKYDKRRIKVVDREGFLEAAKNKRKPGTPKGFKNSKQDVLVKDGTTVKMIPIRDIFLEPNSLDLDRILHRDKSYTYGDLVDGIKNGFDKDSVDQMWMYYENDNFEIEVQPLKFDQGITDPKLPRQSYDKRHTLWELWHPIPRKWIQLDIPETSKEKDEVIPGRIIIGSGKFYLMSEENQNQSLQPPFLKMNYIPTWQSYGTGVAEIIEGLQDELNEIRNQRVDNVSLLMNKIFVVLEKYLVDPNEVRSVPGAKIRVKGSEVDDVRKVVAELPISDVAISSYKETYELEKKIQEVTAANRVTIGSAGLTRDANQTLGGMELLKQAANERFTMYAFLIGRGFLVKAAKKYVELIYQNMPDETVKRILGAQPIDGALGGTINMQTGEREIIPKWQGFKWMAPHDMEMDYDLVPFDVFSEENKFPVSQQLASNLQLTATILPSFNPKPGLEYLYKLSGLPPEAVKKLLEGLDGPVQTPMAMGQGIPSVSKFTNVSPNQNPSGATPPTMNGAAPL